MERVAEQRIDSPLPLEICRRYPQGRRARIRRADRKRLARAYEIALAPLLACAPRAAP